MIVTKNWLDEFVDIKAKSDAELSDALNSVGLEVDNIQHIDIPKGVVVGFVQNCIKHKYADKLSVCEVDIGDRSILFTTGIRVRSLSNAIYTFAIVCAWTPWVLSIMSIAPSLEAKLRLTS